MHVAVFCHNYPPHPGGLEVAAQTVAAGLARRHRVTLVTTAWEGRRGASTEDGLRVHRLPAWHGSEPWGVPYPVPLGRGLRSARREAGGAQLFHAHGALYLTAVLAAREARRRRRPLVLTEHVGWVPYPSRLLAAVQRLAWATLGRYVLARAAVATTYNHRVAGWLAGCRPGLPVRYVGNGVDAQSFRPRPPAERAEMRCRLGLPPAECLVLFVGRETVKKNLEMVLSIPRRDFRLVVCGATRKLPPDVLNLGLVPYSSMPDLYAATDAMIHASVGEGFPLAIQEAMASGLPLVLLWEPGYEGWLAPETVAACLRIEDLGPRLQSLVASPAARREFGERARHWAVERWSWEGTVAAYEDLFLSLVAPEERGGG